ncbi:hypothetical protein DL93DRAFT_2172870 [Clavulina sp. PMI_390]|nr:hypothetical protein DL93DRAFT_2172870 [Clavulina sp. PMI_390]
MSNLTAEGTMSMLAKGAACSGCRQLKMKCDGLKPTCSRCKQRRKECVYPGSLIRRGPITEALEARAMELELQIHKMMLASAHDLSLASGRLLERIGRLGDVVRPKQIAATLDTTWLPIYPQPKQNETGPQGGRIVGEDNAEGYNSVVPRALVEHQLNSYQWTGLEELSPQLSLHLINLFLPYRAQFYFFIDVPHFLHCVSLPPSDPDAIHPCLLNACYLGACAGGGGLLASLQPHFIRRTRHFLEQSLMFADRINHFLWASVAMGCFFARELRSQECFAVAGAATRFGFACGLTAPFKPNVDGKSDSSGPGYLLPQLKDATGLMERIQLAHSLYLMDQTLTLLCGSQPSFPYDERWALSPREAAVRYRYGETSLVNEEQLSKFWRSDTHLKVIMARTFERVMNFARSAASGTSYNILNEEYTALAAQISFQQSSIPPLSDPTGLQAHEAVSNFNPHLLLVHITIYGSGMILHSVRADQDVEARRKMLQCVEGLLDVCEIVRGNKRLRRVQSGLLNAAHMMNAVRIVARELQRSGRKGNARVSTSNCYAIELLLDFIDDITLLNPAWTKTPLLLKAPLSAAASSLMA